MTPSSSAARPLTAGWRNSVLVAFLWRYAAHALMVALSLLAEVRPGHPVHDWLLTRIPYSRWIAVHNYHIWMVAYVPLALWLWRRDRTAFVHFLWVGGVLSLLRGLCILAIPLGPVEGPDLNLGLRPAQLWRAWLNIVNPVSALTTDVAHVSLTKDLFFSGHTSSSFLLWLYCRPHRRLGTLALVAHIVVVATVFAAHIHYTIDVLGAWVITAVVYTAAKRVRTRAAWPTVVSAPDGAD